MVDRIIQLDDNTIGHIAAGEVVERPAQVVKELVENSLDAASSQVTISIERGGFDLIQIEDNGVGILAEDLPLALDRHATSKLSTFTDLNEIHTLGFRGEALASIGIVAKLTVSSRPEGQEGKSITMNFGEKAEVVSHGMPNGTIILVEQIFHNTPARLSFQRRPATEISKIVEVVVSHAIANENVGFKVISDGKTVLDIPVSNNLTDRLYDVLGGQASNLINLTSSQIDKDAPGDEQWSGWISSPDITRGKGDDVYVLINERPVASGPFHQAIRRGYKTRLMQGRHPIAILSLNIPPSEVDVNVHPTKREVRLKHSWRVLEKLERAIAYSLESVPTNPELDGNIVGLSGLENHIEQTSNIAGSDIKKMIESASGIKSLTSENDKENHQFPPWAVAASTQLDLSGKNANNAQTKQKERPTSFAEIPQTTLHGLESKPISPALSWAERDIHKHSKNGETISPENEESLQGVLNDLPEMEPLAQFADSYIVVQSKGELLLIDQHALHERIRYERLKENYKKWGQQVQITPIMLNLDLVKKSVVSNSIEELSELGFNVIIDSDNFMLNSHPTFVPKQDIESFFDDLIQDLSEHGAPMETIEKRIDHMAFLNACRGAVKANEKLNLSEMRRLLEDMRRIPNPWACVHGRPTALRIPIDSLDHHFGRHG